MRLTCSRKLVKSIAMEALLYTMASFALILVLTRFRIPLAVSIVAGSAALGGLFATNPIDMAGVMFSGLINPKSVGLAAITILLPALSEAMQTGGQLQRIVGLFKAFLRRPVVTIVALPALIGLLPMPGGALFSAPMVAAAAGEGEKNGARLSAINYWFRHIWEHWWPLYPGVLLAVQKVSEANMLPLGIVSFMAYQLPLGIFMLIAGFVILRGMHPDMHVSASRPPKGTIWSLLLQTSSIWIVLLVWAGGSALSLAILAVAGVDGEMLKNIPWLRAGQTYVPLSVALLVSFLWTGKLNSLSGKQMWSIFTNKRIYKLVMLVLSVMIFEQMLGYCHAADGIGRGLKDASIPPILVVCAIPFISGLITGLAVGFVGTSFPIVLAIVTGASGESLPGNPLAYMVLAYGMGHLGMMVSPLHLCHVVSNQYFKTPFRPVYKRILPAVLILLGVEVVYFLLLRWLT